MKKISEKTRNRLILIMIVAACAVLALMPFMPEAEINSCMIVTALGIDGGESVTLTAVMTGGSGEESVHGEGAGVTEALEDISERYGKKVEFGHCGAIVLGAEMTSEEITVALKSLLAESEVNAGCAVLSAGGRADEFIRAVVKLGGESGVTDYMGFADAGAPVPVPTALTVLTSLVGKSRAAALPVFSAKSSDEVTGGQGAGNSGSDDSGAPAPEGGGTELVPPRIARAVGSETRELTEEATYGLMIMSPRGKGGALDGVWERGGESLPLRAEITGKSASVKADLTGGVPHFTLEARLKVRFTDRYAVIERTEGETLIRDVSPELEEAFAVTVRRCLEAAAEASRTEDVLGLRTELYRSCPKEYAEFESRGGELYDAVIDTDVTVKIS